MITAGEFRNGVTFEMDGQVMQVVEFQHVKPGKGAAFVRTKMKNVITGAVTETSFNPTAKFENATVDRQTMEYLYADDNLYYFMNPETYEQEPVDGSVLGDNFKFVKENMECTIYSCRDQSPPVHRAGREDPHRHPHRRVSVQSVKKTKRETRGKSADIPPFSYHSKCLADPRREFKSFLRQLCRPKNTLSRAKRGLAPTKRGLFPASRVR